MTALPQIARVAEDSERRQIERETLMHFIGKAA